MAVRIISATDATKYFAKAARIKLEPPRSPYEKSYGFLNIPKSKGNQRSSPNIKILQTIQSILDVNALTGKNLNYQSSSGVWKEFYCFPSDYDLSVTSDENHVEINQIVNKNQESSRVFRKSVCKSFQSTGVNGESQFIFLSGTTGVGKTTFVKYHTKTEKKFYLKSRKITCRVKFKDLEDKLINAANNPEKDTTLELFEHHLINCMCRDVIASYNIAKNEIDKPDRIPLPNVYYDLQDIISTVETKILLLKDENADNDNYVSDYLLFNKIDQLGEGEIAKISLSRKIEFLIEAMKSFNFVVFLDGFDAIEPESIFLNVEDDDHSAFLKCLESVVKGSFSGSGPAYDLLNTAAIVFCISARPITVAQLKLSVQSEVDFDQVFGNESYIAGSPVYDIIKKRMKVRADQIKTPIVDDEINIALDTMKRSLRHLRVDFGMDPNGKFVELFNHNIRDKLHFLSDLADFFLHKVAKALHEDAEKYEKCKNRNYLRRYIVHTDLEELEIESYEIEKILILCSEEDKFINYFTYDAHQKFVPTKKRGAFDNAFNYRKLTKKEQSCNVFFHGCPFLKKYFILKRIDMVKEVIYSDIHTWFESLPYVKNIDDRDIQILIRSGLIKGDFQDGTLIFSLTIKGKFLIDTLIKKYSYFERACTMSMLPRFVRDLMRAPKETSGGEWGRSSIINVAVVLSYIQSLEIEQDVPPEFRIGGELATNFERAVDNIANEGFSGAFENYGGELASGFSAIFKRYGVAV